MSDETTPQYRSYTWEDEQGGCYLALYPGEEDADDEGKAQLRAMGARLAAEQETEAARPGLRLVRDEDSS
ncbi:hypothetical protein ACWCXH_00025 [Kitasatospora sp. NPDC001660]